MGNPRVRRLGYALGAEILGVDLLNPIDDETIAAIRRAWLDHVVLCFRGQSLTPSQQAAFCSRFGSLDDTRSRPQTRHPAEASVQVIVNKPFTIENRQLKPSSAAQWHSDLGYTNQPAIGTFLQSCEIPDVGGDTMFANLYLAYESLSDRYKALVDTIEGVYDLGFYQLGNHGLQQENPEQQAARLATFPPIVHPIVRVHPETGRKALHVGAFLRSIAGMSDDEGRALIDYLDRHATRYEFVYRHRWARHDLLMWDNRCALHYAVADFDGAQLRRMQRCVAPGPVSGSLYEPARLAVSS